MRLTRRELAALVAALPAAAQETIPRNAEEELRAVREQLRSNSEQLGKYQVPMATEPAFYFKA